MQNPKIRSAAAREGKAFGDFPEEGEVVWAQLIDARPIQGTFHQKDGDIDAHIDMLGLKFSWMAQVFIWFRPITTKEFNTLPPF